MEYPNKNMHQYYTDQGTPLGKVLQLLANFEKKPLLEVTYVLKSITMFKRLYSWTFLYSNKVLNKTMSPDIGVKQVNIKSTIKHLWYI